MSWSSRPGSGPELAPAIAEANEVVWDTDPDEHPALSRGDEDDHPTITATAAQEKVG